jgi:hypothetical protein
MLQQPRQPGKDFSLQEPSLCAPGPRGGSPLPERLRWALEHLSGHDLGGVRVHRDSALPAQVGARAFAYGEDIHLSPGAEDALAHEAWHVVQQKQGRVRANGIVRFEEPQFGVVELNDEEQLELEADAMGLVARSIMLCRERFPERTAPRVVTIRRPLVQRALMGKDARSAAEQIGAAVAVF